VKRQCRWPAARIEAGGNESLVGEARRTLALGPPAVAIAPLLADPRLVHEPDLDILSRLPGPHRVDLRSEVFLTDMRRPFANSPFAPLGNAFAIEASSRDLRSCVAFASVVIQAAASRMRKAFIALREPDESIK